MQAFVTSGPWKDYISEKAVIYGRNNPDKKLSKYQERVNEEAIVLASAQPNLVNSRQKLLQLAQDKVHQGGYIFKKGKSRSKEPMRVRSPLQSEKRQTKQWGQSILGIFMKT